MHKFVLNVKKAITTIHQHKFAHAVTQLLQDVLIAKVPSFVQNVKMAFTWSKT
jgi:hypothetical protein